MEFRSLVIPGPVEMVTRRIADERGYFSEIFRRSEFEERVGPAEFVQENESLSVKAGTIRGIHFQTHPAAQGKLVRCVKGKVFDVAVDLRRDSPTFGKWDSVLLSPDQNNQVWIPVGFGHGFCTLESNSIIIYRVTNYYSPENDRGIAWNDPNVGIAWPAIACGETLSSKDRQQPALEDLPSYFSVND